MNLRVEKWGTSLALCIPAEVVRSLGIKEGDSVKAYLTVDSGLSIRPATWDRKAFGRELAAAREAMPVGGCVMDDVRRGPDQNVTTAARASATHRSAAKQPPFGWRRHQTQELAWLPSLPSETTRPSSNKSSFRRSLLTVSQALRIASRMSSSRSGTRPALFLTEESPPQARRCENAHARPWASEHRSPRR